VPHQSFNSNTGVISLFVIGYEERVSTKYLKSLFHFSSLITLSALSSAKKPTHDFQYVIKRLANR
jgi:hypothetical protein